MGASDRDGYKEYSFSVGVLKVVSILSFFGGLIGFYYFTFNLQGGIFSVFVDLAIGAGNLNPISVVNIITGFGLGLGGVAFSAVLSLYVGIFKKIVWDE